MLKHKYCPRCKMMKSTTKFMDFGCYDEFKGAFAASIGTEKCVTGLVFTGDDIGKRLSGLVKSLKNRHKVNKITRIEIQQPDVYPNPIDVEYEVLIKFEIGN